MGVYPGNKTKHHTMFVKQGDNCIIGVRISFLESCCYDHGAYGYGPIISAIITQIMLNINYTAKQERDKTIHHKTKKTTHNNTKKTTHHYANHTAFTQVNQAISYCNIKSRKYQIQYKTNSSISVRYSLHCQGDFVSWMSLQNKPIEQTLEISAIWKKDFQKGRHFVAGRPNTFGTGFYILEFCTCSHSNAIFCQFFGRMSYELARMSTLGHCFRTLISDIICINIFKYKWEGLR